MSKARKKKYQHISPATVLWYLKKGYNMREIGDHYKVSRQRIWQVLNSSPDKPIKGWDVKSWRQKRRERNKIEGGV